MKEIKVIKKDKYMEITNNIYLTPTPCVGLDSIYPDIGVEYIYIQWNDTIWGEDYYIDMNNHVQAFTEAQVATIVNFVDTWVQPLGQQGNPNDEQKLEAIKFGIQAHIDAEALSLGFDDINSIAKYMVFANVYKADADSLATWTIAVWEYVEAELVKMQTGQRTIPTLAEAILELPARV